MEGVNECRVLSGILKRPLPCQSTCSAPEITPSFIDDDKLPKGCLIAHTALTLIEVQRMANYFKKPLHRLVKLNRLERSPDMSPDELWDVVLASSLLHDIGKLADQYVERSKAPPTHLQHHQLSAIKAYKVLSEVFHNNYIATVAALAILYHHEALDWRSLDSRALAFSYLRETFTLTKSINYTINQERLKTFSGNLGEALKLLCEEGAIEEGQHDLLLRVLRRASRELLNNKPQSVGEVLSVNNAKRAEFIVPAFFLYRLLYLADNRAASARSRYWLGLLKRVDWRNAEVVAEQIHRALTQRRYYIGLSAIPEVSMKRKAMS